MGKQPLVRNNVGELIADLRGKRAVQDVAKVAKMDPANWTNIEHGRRPVGREGLRRILDALGASPMQRAHVEGQWLAFVPPRKPVKRRRAA